jgi:hypothetical protein
MRFFIGIIPTFVKGFDYGEATWPRVLVYAPFWQYSNCLGAATVQNGDCYWCRYLCNYKYILSANTEFNCGSSRLVTGSNICCHIDSTYDLFDNANYYLATQTLVVEEEIILMYLSFPLL